MNKTISVVVAALIIAGGGYYFTTAPDTGASQGPAPTEGEPIVTVTLPEALSTRAELGARAFDAVCADCHGDNAAGRMGYGPPLVHKIYEPSHHGDMAFQLAVQNGVRAHHWQFGNMPAQDGLTQADVGNIVAYVRELQRTNGIN
ncbi:MAG: cytochrome C [Maritimibacter sp.]|nr:cytochrome C [Maritimibacter sp.]